MYFIEVRYTIRRMHDPILIPLDRFSTAKGYTFRSVYAYNNILADKIRRTKQTTNLQGESVYSDTLFIDVDASTKDVDDFRNMLLSRNLAFTQWSTGNRGGHFHIPISPMEGIMIPQSQIYWIQNNFDITKVDISIYNPNGQIRLPMAVHTKTGQVKLLTYRRLGNILNIPIITIPKPRLATSEPRKATYSSYVYNLTKYIKANRHMHIMIIVKEAISLELSLDRVIEDVIHWNKSGWVKDPLPEYEVIRHVRKTWRYNK